MCFIIQSRLARSNLAQIKFKLLAFQNAPVGTPRLARARREACQDTASDKLVHELPFQLCFRLALCLLALHVVGADSQVFLDGRFVAATQRGCVVLFVPLAHWDGVDLDNGAHDEGVCAHQLVVGGIVHHADDAGLARHCLRAPRKVSFVRQSTCFEAQGTELLVAAAHSHDVDALLADLGVCGLAAQLELSLLAVLGALGAGVRALVAAVSRNAHKKKSGLFTSCGPRPFSFPNTAKLNELYYEDENH